MREVAVGGDPRGGGLLAGDLLRVAPPTAGPGNEVKALSFVSKDFS